MPVDTSMWERLANPPNPLDSYIRMKQMKVGLDAAAQEKQLRALQIQHEQMQLSELSRQQNEAAAGRDAFSSAAQQGQTSNVDVPGVQVGGMDLGGHTSTVQGPGIDRNVLLSELSKRGLGQQAMAQQQQFQQQDFSRQEQLLKIRGELSKLNTEQLQQVKLHGELVGKYALPVYQLEQSGAPPEVLQRAWTQQLQAAQQGGVDVSNVSQQYSPGAGGQLISMARDVNEALKSDTQKQQFQVEQSGKTVPTAEGVKQYNPKTMTYDKSIGKPTSAIMAGNLNLSPEATALAANLYSQTGQLPAGFGRAPQVTANVIEQAARQPGQDIAANKLAYGGKKATTTYFTSGAGAKQLTAFNTAITHLDTLNRLADDLGNSDVQIVNKAKQAWATQTGNPAPANFAAAKNAMSGEVAAALKASGATDQEITHVSSTFDNAQSPAQLKGAIGTYRELLNSKAQQLQRQYESGMQGQPAFSGALRPNNALPGAQGGISVTDPSGGVHTFPNQAAANAFKQAAGIQQ